MTTDAGLAAAQARFREHVAAEWAAASQEKPDTDQANRLVAANDALVKEWAAQGTVSDVLLPLLEDESLYVRCAAASYLLYHGEADRAKAVLEALVATPGIGRVGSRARIALIGYRKQQDKRA